MAIISKVVAKTSDTSDIQSNIESLKFSLSDEQVNTAVRKYQHVLKTLRSIDFIVSPERKDFYKQIFLHALQEEEIYNIKDLL